jgi:hypothetical protein
MVVDLSIPPPAEPPPYHVGRAGFLENLWRLREFLPELTEATAATFLWNAVYAGRVAFCVPELKRLFTVATYLPPELGFHYGNVVVTRAGLADIIPATWQFRFQGRRYTGLLIWQEIDSAFRRAAEAQQRRHRDESDRPKASLRTRIAEAEITIERADIRMPLSDVSQAGPQQPAHDATEDDYHACIDALYRDQQPRDKPQNFDSDVWPRASAWLLRNRNATANYKAMRHLFRSDRHQDKRRKPGQH